MAFPGAPPTSLRARLRARLEERQYNRPTRPSQKEAIETISSSLPDTQLPSGPPEF